jgi:hypothetical protein
MSQDFVQGLESEKKKNNETLNTLQECYHRLHIRASHVRVAPGVDRAKYSKLTDEQTKTIELELTRLGIRDIQVDGKFSDAELTAIRKLKNTTEYKEFRAKYHRGKETGTAPVNEVLVNYLRDRAHQRYLDAGQKLTVAKNVAEAVERFNKYLEKENKKKAESNLIPELKAYSFGEPIKDFSKMTLEAVALKQEEVYKKVVEFYKLEGEPGKIFKAVQDARQQDNKKLSDEVEEKNKLAREAAENQAKAEDFQRRLRNDDKNTAKLTQGVENDPKLMARRLVGLIAYNRALEGKLSGNEGAREYGQKLQSIQISKAQRKEAEAEFVRRLKTQGGDLGAGMKSLFTEESRKLVSNLSNNRELSRELSADEAQYFRNQADAVSYRSGGISGFFKRIFRRESEPLERVTDKPSDSSKPQSSSDASPETPGTQVRSGPPKPVETSAPNNDINFAKPGASPQDGRAAVEVVKKEFDFESAGKVLVTNPSGTLIELSSEIFRLKQAGSLRIENDRLLVGDVFHTEKEVPFDPKQLQNVEKSEEYAKHILAQLREALK